MVVAGCGFSRTRQLMATPSSGIPKAEPSRPKRNSSSSDACADSRNRSCAGTAGSGDAVGRLGQRLAPVHGLVRPAAFAQERALQAVVTFDPVVVEPADVAHPVAVDVGVEPRGRPDEPSGLRPLGLRLQPRRRVAALFAERADRVDRFGVVPRARLEPVVARRDRADRAHVHQVARDQRVDALFLERRDLAAVAAIDDVDLRVAVDLAHEPDAARAEDAAVAIQHQRRTEIDVRLHALAVEHAARKLHPALVGSERV